MGEINDRKISFELTKMELIEDNVDNLKFAKVKLYAFKTGDNSHMVTATEKVLMQDGDTILRCPLVCYYDRNTGDLAGHEPDETSIGFVPQDSKITYEKDENGETWLCVEALIWKQYSGEVLALFQNSNDEKPVSVELLVLDSNKVGNEEIIKRFAFFAVTILGSLIPPSVKRARAEVVQYAQDKKEYEQNHNMKKEETEMDEKTFDVKEYCAKFNMTYQEMADMIYKSCSEGEMFKEGEVEYSRYYMVDFCNMYVYACDYSEDNYKAIPYEITDGKSVVKFEEARGAKRVWMVSKPVEENGEIQTYEKEFDINVEFKTQKDAELVKASEDELVNVKTTNETLVSEKTELEKTIEEMQSQFSEKDELIANLNSYKELKEDEEIENAKVKRLSDITFAMNDIREKAPAFPKEELESWEEKARNYSENEEWVKYENIDTWKLELSAKALDYASVKKEDDGISRYQLPFVENEHKRNKGIWTKHINNT